jgi:hypothetical protein
MHIVRRTAVAAFVVGTLLFGATAAWADPTGSKNNFSFPASCSGSIVNFVVNSANGQGAGAQNNNTAPFAPAHVVGSNQIFHPTVFNLTFSFTPAGEPTQSFLNTNAMLHPKTPVSCEIDFSQTDNQGNTFALNGTVWGFFS